MAAYLQWRRFVFFDREMVKEPPGPEAAGGKPFALPPGITVCDSGRGNLVFGDMEGRIWFLPRSLQLSGFQAYKLRVTHLYQLKQHSILVSVGEDEEGINPLVKVWNLEKRDGGNPLCTRIFPAIPGNKPTVVSCLTVHENLNFMAIGFADGSVVLTKGDITRDRHSKTQILHEGSYPVTGLAFRQSGKTTHLFVVTTENIQSYLLSVKDYSHLELDNHGCGLHCSSLSDPSQDLQFIVAGNECVYLYQPDERGPCFAFEGQKLIVHWYRGYLIIVSKDRKTSPKYVSLEQLHFLFNRCSFWRLMSCDPYWLPLQNYQEALHYIGKLPFDQAESNMKRYGKILMHHVPKETTELLKNLCTDYQPSGNSEGPGILEGKKANSEEFIPVFANNSRELKAFLEHMTEVQSDSPQGVYDTLLELRLQNWAHEVDKQIKEKLHDEALTLLKSGRFKTVFDKALVLCQMHNFKDGVLYLYEQGKLFQQIMHYHMQNEQYKKVIEVCELYGDQEACLWEQALGYFARKEEDCKEYIAAVLKHIENKNLMPPLLVVQTLAHNSTATLSVIKDYLVNKLQKQSCQIEQDGQRIQKYRDETTRIRQEIEELKASPKIFQKTKCSICTSALELPSVHFLCGHSFHQHCFESYSESDSECPTCMPENRKVMDMIRAQEQKRDLHDQFQHQLKCSNDGFSVVADYFGRGVFNKLTLITDLPLGKSATTIEAGLQRELLMHTKRST
ncbi:vacuolar protein sorting-associated protein 11 homolog [Meleagris gallopavo]|uniref:vacuolar protein sorting-associated protein 11 homolog n=1 Tax=Meleagris gallopavo TaxID=9103 RepID=UPI00093A4073|nr:vacuolar protein sorting-associated protein 11 homolog [Meleagris gallopavo]